MIVFCEVNYTVKRIVVKLHAFKCIICLIEEDNVCIISFKQIENFIKFILNLLIKSLDNKYRILFFSPLF